MSIQNFPERFLSSSEPLPDLFVHDYKMTNDVIKSKVNMSMNTFSFLQTGSKQVHFSDTSVAVNEQQSILIKNSNCLVTELLNDEHIYFCKLFFFSQKSIADFLIKYNITLPKNEMEVEDAPYFIIKNDDYITQFVNSLSSIMALNPSVAQDLLKLKFDEIMLYLIAKYSESFIAYILSLVSNNENSSFRKIIETNVSSNLKLEEIAFLCNMSLSSFKRHFQLEFGETPGKWFQRLRLTKAKEILQIGKLKPSEIYYDFGYNNLSNFSIAFKNEFGVSPNNLDKLN